MKSSELLIGAGIAIAGYFLYKKYMSITGLQFVPLGVSTGGAGLLVNIGVQNPTNQPITVRSFAGSLMANNTVAANVSNFQNITINPNSQTPIQFSVAPNWIGLGVNIVDEIQNGWSDVSFSLKGTANLDGTPVPVNINF